MTRAKAAQICQAIKFILGREDYSEEVEEALNMAIEALSKGHWIEKEVFDNQDSEVIESYQSARCSHCGKYHTTPYSYFFDNYNFCPNCGADMRERSEE
jgi:Zn finger protein HypA/HybF involved in hydrogenase expression